MQSEKKSPSVSKNMQIWLENGPNFEKYIKFIQKFKTYWRYIDVNSDNNIKLLRVNQPWIT